MKRPVIVFHRPVAAAILAFMLTSCEWGTVDKGIRYIVFARPLPTAEIEALYRPGLTLALKWADGTTGAMQFGPDGDLQVTREDRTVGGRWYLSENRVCTDYGAAGGMCYVTYRGKDHYRIFDSRGSLFGDARKTA